ncbi:uncharacterized protein cenpu isoform 2-T2 [Pholidichthys leucotaenia]
MSAKKRRRAEERPEQKQKASSFDQMDSPDLSAIDKASFLEGLQPRYDNPLHSTAVEDLKDLENGQIDQGLVEGRDPPKTMKTAAKPCGTSAKGKEMQENGEEEKGEKKRSRRRGIGRKVTARPENEPAEEDRVDSEVEKRRSALSPDPEKRSTGHMSAPRQMKNQKMEKRVDESDSGESSHSWSEESDSGSIPQRRRRVLSSDEDGDDNPIWTKSPSKPRMCSSGKSGQALFNEHKPRKTSSGSSSGELRKTSTDKKKRETHGGTELGVVLDAFLEFCDQYRESVESKAVKQSIDWFSNNVKDQLLEKMASCKKLKVLKRENAKMGSVIRKKTQRLYDAKYELMRAEREAWLLRKEKAELEQRLTDLRRGQAFLHDIKELNRLYLDYRRKHRKEKEMYGASSLPALLWEAKHVSSAKMSGRPMN